MQAIFHHPLPLDPSRPVASALRPVKMLQAFRSAGYTVDVVAGYAAERRAASKVVQDKLAGGTRYDFMYSESSTLPTLLTEPNRLPTNPMVDFGLMQACRRRGVPVGLFYRDMYWMFPQFKRKYGGVARLLLEQFYRYDLRQYAALVDKLYVPSIEMGHSVPIVDEGKISALPPGHDVVVAVRPKVGGEGLSLLYVGGTGPHYEMQELFSAIDGLDGVSLTLCTREADWLASVGSLVGAMPTNVTVVHVNGDELDRLYEQSDIALIYVAPQDYWSFAAPYKLYEYLGKGKPIIASEGTLVSNFVESNGVGWCARYDAASLRRLLETLLRDPEQVESRALAVASIAPMHTWSARAATVVTDMANVRNMPFSRPYR